MSDQREVRDGGRYELRIRKLEDIFGGEWSALRVWRTDVDEDEDPPVMGPEIDNNTDFESVSGHRISFEGVRVEGEFWRDEWVEHQQQSVTMMQPSDRYRRGLFGIVVLTLLLLTMLVPVQLSWAGDKEKFPTACDQNESIGSVFYDFDAIYIYYVGFMSQEAIGVDFPEALKFENFNAKLVEAIKKNFSLCLTTETGAVKPIVVIPPQHIKVPDKSKYNPKLIHDPKNLTLILRGNYYPQYEISSGVKGVGHVFSFWYRPETPYKPAHMALGRTSSVLVLPPLNGTNSIDEQLDNFFKSRGPLKTADPESFRKWISGDK